jgi:hypothetical protein
LASSQVGTLTLDCRVADKFYSNIDRMLALYQALNPQKYVSANELLKPLVPFEKDSKKNCFTSGDDIVKNYWSPGFAIPGAEKLDDQVVREKVREYITNTYFWYDLFEFTCTFTDL